MCLLQQILLILSLLSLSEALISYKETCTENTECITKFCSPISKTCDCLEFTPGRVKATNVQVFDLKTQSCRSLPGTFCKVLNHKTRYDMNCVPNASCKRGRLENELISNIYGLCECDSGFRENDDHLCEKFVEESVVIGMGMSDADFSEITNKKVPSTDNADPRPFGSYPTASKVQAHKENKDNEQIHVPQRKKELLQEKAFGHSGSGQRSSGSGVMMTLVLGAVLLWFSNCLL